MAESEEALQLKRRARRRLVGAIALVAFVIIILPLLLDKEPAPSATSLSVQIPKQDSGSFNNRVSPPLPPLAAPEGKAGAAAAPVAKPDAPAANADTPAGKPDAPASRTDAATVKVAPAGKQESPVANPPAAAAAGKIAAAPVDNKSADARAQVAPADQSWVVALGSFSSAENVKQLRSKLSAAGVKTYTETLKTAKGEQQTRVRAGPFASKEAADKAHERIAAMGLKPGPVTKR
jgi:DedD protein